jgi:hypothetical protein
VHTDREALNDYPLGLYDVTVEIVTFEPDQEVAWTVHGQRAAGHARDPGPHCCPRQAPPRAFNPVNG